MSRLVRRSIEVQAWRGEVPKRFRDGDQVHDIHAVMDHWVEMGDWWNGEGPRTLFRVWTHDEGIFDLECLEGEWYIYKVWD